MLNGSEALVHMPSRLKDQARAVAWSTGQTVGGLIRGALREFLARQSRLPETVQEWTDAGRPNDYSRGRVKEGENVA
jgi:hypothetical protein